MLYWISCFIDAFLRVYKNILVNGNNKLFASLINTLLYVSQALFIKFIVQEPWHIALIVVAINSFIGCYLAMWFHEKMKKK